MKAMFIIHESDPEEYFQQMADMSQRVLDSGGKYKVVKAWSEKFNAVYYEHHFQCEYLKNLLEPMP